MYTLTVAHDHTFFVGHARVLMHNAGGACNNINGAAAEALVRYVTGGTATRIIWVSGSEQVERRVDALTRDLVAYESKAGRIVLEPRIREEVEKDAYLLRTGRVKKVIWAFLKSPVTNKIGPSRGLRTLLEQTGIEIHIITDTGVIDL